MADVCTIDWHIHLMRVDRWLEVWLPAAERALAFGAGAYSLTRSEEDPNHFRQTSTWEDRTDFERYWHSDELAEARQRASGLHNLPVIPQWHLTVAES